MSRLKTVPQGFSWPRFGARRRLRAGLLALTATATAVFAAPTPSMAAGDDFYNFCDDRNVSCQTGVRVSYPAGVCDTASASFGSTRVCVDYNGDYVYVRDNKADNRSAVAYIKGGGGTVTYRHCRNPYGAGPDKPWARCNFDWRESGQKSVYGGYRVTSAYGEYGHLWSFSNN